MVTRTGTRSAERHPAAAHAAHHSLHAAHHALHAAAAQLAHHLFHLLVLLHQLVDVGRGHAGAGGDALAARTVEQGRVAAFLLRHRIDDRHHPRHFLAGDLRLDVVGNLANARQLVHQPGQAAHVLHLLELVLHVVEVELAALGDLLRQLLRLVLVDLLLDLLDQRQHVAHVQDAAGDAVGVEHIQPVDLLAGADELDRLAGDVAHRKRRTAGGIARKVLDHVLPQPVSIRGALVQMGPHRIERANWDWGAIEQNPFWCPDATAATDWEDYLDGVRKAGYSIGAVIEVVASGVPAGLGEPVYDKLDADLAQI